VDGLFDPDPDAVGRTYCTRGGFLDDVAGFDAEFFGISPREALSMDPQQRLLLEVAWEAIERSGLDPRSLAGTRTATYVGANQPEYGIPVPEGTDRGGYLVTGSSASVLSGRLAYVLGLEGAAVTVETACSSSLVALHTAVTALRAGECDRAIVAGVAVMASPTASVEFSRQRGLAPDGVCKAFAEGADGMVLAEGVGVVVLERFSDAHRDERRVRAVIRGSAINQDGASNGLTAPSGPAQERVIRAAVAAAGLGPADVDLVEGHGTGTALGDPIEANALLATYGRGRPADRPLWIGSVKSNIGHTQAAAGLAGVIKPVTALEQGVVPGSVLPGGPSSLVDWTSGAVRVAAEQQAWPQVDRVRRAAVSSFGVSGTNAHVILEQAPEQAGAPVDDSDEKSQSVAWAFSAHTETALRARATGLAELADRPGTVLADVAHALAATAGSLGHRAVAWGTDHASLARELRRIAAEPGGVDVAPADLGLPSGSASGRSVGGPGPVWVFSGQGGQWAGMAAGSLSSSPVFAEAFADVAQALREHVTWDPVELLTSGDTAWLGRTEVVQPLLWAGVVALARWWRAVGVEPAAVVGHSQGEVAAAVVAGVLSVEDGARVVCARSRLAAATDGGMAILSGPEDAVRRCLDERRALSVAARNSPVETIVSGPAEAIAALVDGPPGNVHVRRVKVDYAAHSASVEAVRDELLAVLAPITPRHGDVAWLSTVTGEWLDGTCADAGYWYRNLRETVAFGPAVATLAQAGHRHFVEVSPHPTLAAAVGDVLAAHPGPARVTTTLRRDQDGPAVVLAAAAHAWIGGAGL
ncbi:MAG: type I polyketide synthase, partial [Pseudonocardia sp.]|nr:type I polyketide synthase [Pseudonocardia sp.]